MCVGKSVFSKARIVGLGISLWMPAGQSGASRAAGGVLRVDTELVLGDVVFRDGGSKTQRRSART